MNLNHWHREIRDDCKFKLEVKESFKIKVVCSKLNGLCSFNHCPLCVQGESGTSKTSEITSQTTSDHPEHPFISDNIKIEDLDDCILVLSSNKSFINTAFFVEDIVNEVLEKLKVNAMVEVIDEDDNSFLLEIRKDGKEVSSSILNGLIRRTTKYLKWRKNILDNNNKCMSCSSLNNLEVHHIIPIYEIIKKNYLSSLKDALECDELWSNNVKVLCIDCHKKEHSG